MRYLGVAALAAMLSACNPTPKAPQPTQVKPTTVAVLPTGEAEPSFFGFGSYTFPAMIRNNDVVERGCVYRSGADISTALTDDAVLSRAQVLEFERMSIREAYRAQSQGQQVTGQLISSRRTPTPMGCYVMDSITWGVPPPAPAPAKQQ